VRFLYNQSDIGSNVDAPHMLSSLPPSGYACEKGQRIMNGPPQLQQSSYDAVKALEALVVDNADLERLEALLDQFNIFDYRRCPPGTPPL
jgi:hypothetical protein